MQFALFVTIALFATCLEAVPIKKRSASSGATVEFHMPQTEFDHYPWDYPNDKLEAESVKSKSNYNNTLSCPEHPLEGNNLPLYMRSTCPWYYKTRHVAGQFPTTILEASSLCDYCIGSSGYQCQAIRRTITVLRKKSDTSNEFVESEMEIDVGFTCAGGLTKPNGTPAPATAPPSGNLPDFAK